MTVQALPKFSLNAAQVPDPPDSTLWIDQLKWAVTVADADDSDLAFLASLLSHAIRGGGLTLRQEPHARKAIDRLEAMWREGRLRAQQIDPADSPWRAPALADVKPAGEA
jgi:hypothetical protein